MLVTSSRCSGIFAQRLTGAQPATAGLDLSKVYEDVERLIPEATLVHAEDYDPADDGTPLFDLPRALGIVAASGFSGPVSAEWGGQLGDAWDHATRTLTTVRRTLPALQ